MADVLDFKKLAEATEVEEVLDTDKVFVERDGVIHRVTKDKVGGSGTYVLKPKPEDLAGNENGATVYNTNYDDLARAMEKGMSVMVLIPANENMPISMLYTVSMMGYIDEDAAVTGGFSSKGVFLVSESLGELFLPNGSYVPTL